MKSSSSGIDESVNDELVDRIEGRGDQERGAHALPATMDELPTIVSVCEGRPQIGRPTLSCVLQAGARSNHRSDRRLKDESENSGSPSAAREMLPPADDHVGNDVSLHHGVE